MITSKCSTRISLVGGSSASSMISGRRFFNYEDVKGQIQRS